MRPSTMLPRSYLYVPADRGDRLDRAHDRGADAVIADLEDGVAPGHKTEASQTLGAWLDTRPAAPAARAETWVRPDPQRLADDVALLCHRAVTGVVVPKVEGRSELQDLADVLADTERALEREHPVVLTPLIESARGLRATDEIATAPRVRRMGMGEADLCGELGLEPDPSGAQLAHARWAVVLASAVAGLAPPVASTSTDFRDLETLETSTRHLRSLGFRARTAIHPSQLTVINTTFTPTAEDVEHAREVVSAARQAGGGAAVGPDGRMIDAAVLRSAHDVLARARG